MKPEKQLDDRADRARDDHRRFLLRAHLSSQQSFDKAVLAIASGGIGVSLVFLRDVIGLRAVFGQWLLFVSWICMAAALVSIFISFLTSEGAIREKIESLDAEKHGVKDLSEWTQWLNRASAVLVVAGVALLLVFAAKNLAGAPAMPSNRDDGLKKGYVPPDPPPARPGRPPAPPPTRQPDPQPPAKKP